MIFFHKNERETRKNRKKATHLILEIPCNVGNRHSGCGALDFDWDPRYSVDYVSDGCLSSFCRIYGSQCSQFAQNFHRFSSCEKMGKCFLDLLKRGAIEVFWIFLYWVGMHVFSPKQFPLKNRLHQRKKICYSKWIQGIYVDINTVWGLWSSK